jgi:predicted RNA-binding protein with RPS1 domain
MRDNEPAFVNNSLQEQDMVHISEMKDSRVSPMLIDMGGFFFSDEKIQIHIVSDQKAHFHEVTVCS